MAQRLKNIVRFTGLTPGVPASLPHGLITQGGRPLVPDLLAPAPLDGFTVTADETNITVTGNGIAVDVLCEAWHTVERSFANVAVEDLVPQPFVIGAGLGSEIYDNFIFRPGGIPNNNVFTDWETLYAALSQTTGWRTLQFDSTFMNCVIPPGEWDMTSVEFMGLTRVTPGGVNAQVDITEGARLLNLQYIGNDLQINNLCTATAPIVLPPTGQSMEIGFAATGVFPIINNVGGAPLVDCSQLTGSGIIVCRMQCRVAGTATVFQFGAAPAGTRGIFIMAANSEFRANMIGGSDPGQIITAQTVDPTATFSRQSTFAGTILRGRPNGGAGGIGGGFMRTMYLPATPAPASPAAFTYATGLGMGAAFRFDTTLANIVQVLPKIQAAAPVTGASPISTSGTTAGVLESTGMTVTIKNEVGANAVNVVPEVGDTIEVGAAMIPPVNIPAGASRTFMSDGVSNWIIVAGWL